MEWETSKQFDEFEDFESAATKQCYCLPEDPLDTNVFNSFTMFERKEFYEHHICNFFFRNAVHFKFIN